MEERRMSYTLPAPEAILEAWRPFKEVIGVTSVRTEEDYNRAMSLINSLLDVIKGDEDHPLADVLNYLSDLVIPYEEEHHPIPDASPRDLLEFLMEQQGLKQEDLADCAPQSRISEILNGKRTISKEIARRLAKRFKVSVNLFI
jgi:HTH-type transcriptional regulator / antitoxin HigA